MPLILLHGNSGSLEYFENQIKHFSVSYRVIAVDTRGHGKSKRGIMPFTMQQFACDLGDFMDSLDIQSAIILGFSDGANIAMKFALQYPDKVKALILNSGNLNREGLKGYFRVPVEFAYKTVNAFAAKSKKNRLNAELMNLILNEPNIDPIELNKINVPTLVISGNRDIIKKSHTNVIADNIPNAKLSIIKGSHSVAKEHPDEFNKEVGNFLNEIEL